MLSRFSELKFGFNMKLNVWEAPATFLCGNVCSKTQMGDFCQEETDITLFTTTFVLWRPFGGLSPTRPVPLNLLQRVQVEDREQNPGGRGTQWEEGDG